MANRWRLDLLVLFLLLALMVAAVLRVEAAPAPAAAAGPPAPIPSLAPAAAPAAGPGRVPAARTVRPDPSRRAGLAGDKAAGRFPDLDLAGLRARVGGAGARAAAAAAAGPPLALRARAGAAPAASASLAGKAAAATPWSADRLLADPTQMNDEHVSLAVSPITGHLYAAFSARDLGGTDRDIHLARSADGGVQWETVELPSFSQDEYQPDLAIDAVGYLHLVWIRADGVVVRARSDAPDDPSGWIVRGLAVGDPLATPTIAVSGAGDFARVFIALSWLSFNSSTWGDEWTLLWMWSTNGGLTVTADWLDPDGYPDYWPDAALAGGLCYLVNGEENPYTGEIEILAAVDAISGSFAAVTSLTDWTPMSCGFPSLAADGPSVHCVYQLDWDDGTGTVDGDVIYWRSLDGLASVEGPYAMAADERESLGPSIHAADGLVGCLWLDGPAGADELALVGSQCGLDGDPGAWTAVEAVSDLSLVEPVFHAAAGITDLVPSGQRLHAAWIDRRDFPTSGLNVYTADRAIRPDLSPWQPAGWGGPLVVSPTAGGRETAPVPAGGPAYVSFALANLGLAPAAAGFLVRLTLDGAPLAEWSVGPGLPHGSYVTVEDHVVAAAAGEHLLEVVLDPAGAVAEEDESDNRFGQAASFVEGTARLRLGASLLERRFASPDAATKAAASPPLRRRVHLPVLAPSLAAALAGAAPAQRLRVVIEPAERVDAAALAEALGTGRDKARRTAAVTALKRQAERLRGRLGTETAALVRSGRMTPPRVAWLTGAATALMTPAAVAELAGSPLVGRLWLDDVRNRPLGGPDGGPLAAALAPAHQAADAKATLPWHLTVIGADRAWAAGRDGTGILVGHTDTGVVLDHPDLVGGLWDGGAEFPNHGWDCLDEDDEPYDGDTGSWHGTHTAGLIVGDGSSGQRTGAAPGARLIVTRCVPGYWQDLVEALQFCLDHGADVVTTSAGWPDPDDALREACRDAAAAMLAAGVPWICAAGNGDNAGGHYPAPRDVVTPGDCPHPWYGEGGHTAVIAVGASDAGDGVWSYGSRGPTAWDIVPEAGYDDYPWTPGLIKPDLVAPGAGVTSTVLDGYATYSGTSMATPLVAAACAVLLQADPALGPADLGRILETSAVDLAEPGRDVAAGAGRIDLPAALGAIGGAASLGFGVHDVGVLPLDFDATWSAPWLDLAPAAGTVAAGDSLRLVAVLDPSGLPVGLYQDTIVFASNDPDGPHRLPVRMIIGEPTGVDGGEPPPVDRPALAGHPNPFNPTTTLTFSLSRAGPVELRVWDARGRLVRTLLATDLPAGRHEVTWDGRDARGRQVASGVYLARLKPPRGPAATRKLALVR